jgi:hypothetical protein
MPPTRVASDKELVPGGLAFWAVLEVVLVLVLVVVLVLVLGFSV